MFSFKVFGVFIIISCHCRLTSASYCDFILTKDCAFMADQSKVCGSNGVTYRNSCFLAKAYCADNSIHKVGDGACAPATTVAMASPRTTAPTMATATSDPLSVICGVMDHVHCATDVEPVCGSDDRTYVNRECLRFCFMRVLQNELDLAKKEWNEHRVRFQCGDQPTGKPELLFQHPELYGSQDYKFPVDMTDVRELQEMCSYPSDIGCTEEAQDIFTDIMNERQLNFPDTHKEAIDFLKAMKMVY